MTDAQYAAWLLDTSGIRLVLVEAIANIAGTETTIYLSTSGYVTGPTDTPANTVYLPMIETGVQYSENITLNEATDFTTASNTAGTSSMTGGDIAIFNINGELDAWLGYAWINRSIKAYIGDPGWDGISSAYTRADFRLIFNGVISDIHSASNDRLNLIMADKTTQLNVPITAQLLGGTTANANALIPLTFGECFNVTPLLIDPTLLEYQVHNGPIESIIEVRDNGVPVPFTATLSAGTFVLNQSPFGAVTCSVQGDKYSGVYTNTAAGIIQRLVTGFGVPGLAFTSGDLDAANLSAFDTAHPQPMGIYITGTDTVWTTCQALAASIGAEPIMSRQGLLQLIQITFPVPGTPTTIDVTQMEQRSFEIVDRSTVCAGVLLGYCKNWTTQTLVTSLPAEALSIFLTPYMLATETDSTTQTLYKLSASPIEQDGYLLATADAQAEATRQLDIFKVPRTTYQFVATNTSGLMNLVLGQAVTIYHPRYGMSGGVTGMVITLAPDWMTGKLTVKVLV